MGVLNKEKSLAGIEKLTASSFCRYYFVVQSIRRRRLPVVLVRLGMANTLEQADTFVKHVLFSISIFYNQQGHVRVGVDLVTDPAYLVTRNMEDYVTWVDTSKIRKHIMKYNDKLDDYDLLGEYDCLFYK